MPFGIHLGMPQESVSIFTSLSSISLHHHLFFTREEIREKIARGELPPKVAIDIPDEIKRQYWHLIWTDPEASLLWLFIFSLFFFPASNSKLGCL
jgi:hypothetical protein